MATTSSSLSTSLFTKPFASLSSWVWSLYRRYRGLPLSGKCLVWIFFLVNLSVWSIFIYFTPAKVAQALYDFSQKLRNTSFGWLILAAIMVVASFPPLVGFSTCVSLCGFAWGMQGFFLALPATVVGSAAAFVVCRYLMQERVKRFATKNQNWKALEAAIRSRGLLLVVLIRFSPLPPFVYSNALCASISSIALWQFIIATICTFPRILLTIFISSRIAIFSDGKQRGELDTMSKILNVISIIIGIAVGTAAGWLIYNQMQREIGKAESQVGEGRDGRSLAPEALEAAPLLSDDVFV